MLAAKTTSGARDDASSSHAAAYRVSPLLWALLACVVGAWFLTLGLRHLLPTDEGRYAEIAREMVSTGDWLTIRYNGVKYFEKPPLQMWATAIAFELFGVGEWQARLWSALSGAGGVAIAALAARRWYGDRVAVLTACVLLAAPAWNIAGHLNSLDMGVSFAMACVLCGVLLAQHPAAAPGERRAWMWFAWGAMGAAVMSKGLMGIVLPLLALGLYALAAGDRAIWRRLHPIGGVAILLAVTVPWFVLVSLRNPEFARFFFIHEHWQRFTSTVHHHAGPWWYFGPQLLMGFLPWLGLLPRMARAAAAPRGAAAFRPAAFLAAWAVSIVVFFSVSGSKLPGYIIPIYPALAILAAVALDGIDRRAWTRQIDAMLAFTSVALLATLWLARLGGNPEAIASYQSFAPWLAAGCALAVACLAGARVLARREAPGHAVASAVAYALAFFALVTVTLVGHESFGRNSSGIALVEPIEAVLELDPGMPIYSVRMLDHTLPFYLRHTTVMVQSPDELDFGVHQEPDKWLPTVADFEREWKTPRRALAIMSHETYDSFKAEGLAMVPVAEDTRRIVVTNLPKTAS